MSRYLPNVSSLISVEHLPSAFAFLQNASNNFLEDVYYDHYQKIVSPLRDQRIYNLDIILNKQIGFNIPGANISFLLNPNDDYNNPQSTSFNITVCHEWGILKYLNEFNVSNFSFSVDSLLQILLKVFELEPGTILRQLALYLGEGRESGLLMDNTEEEVVYFLNDHYQLTGTSNELSYTSTTTFADIAIQLGNAGIQLPDVIATFGIPTDYPAGNDTAADIFKRIVIRRPAGLSIDTFIKELNDFYQLTGTADEIPYHANPETTFEEIYAALSNAGVEVVQLVSDYILTSSSSFSEAEDELLTFFVSAKGTTYFQSYLSLFKLRLGASVNDINAAIEFPRNYLVPIDIDPTSPNYDKPIADPAVKSRLRFNVGRLRLGTDGGLMFENENSITFRKSQIGNTGLRLSFSNMKLDLSKSQNIDEAIADGRPEDFIGVYIQTASIEFPQKWRHSEVNSTAVIEGQNLLIGTGGVSGSIQLKAKAGLPQSTVPTSLFKLGDAANDKHFELGLNQFSIEFKQNSIVQSDINGYLKIPGFIKTGGGDAKIDIWAHIGNNGDFRITASNSTGAYSLDILDTIRIELCSVSVGSSNDRWYIEASGKLTIIANIPGLTTNFKDSPIEIKRIRIWQDGNIEFNGGNTKLSISTRISIGPVSLQIEELTFGSYEKEYAGQPRQYFYFGFNGALNTGPGGVNVSGDGIEYHFTRDGGTPHRYLKISGLGVEIKVPGNAKPEDADVYIKGYLAMRSGENLTQGNPNAVTATGPAYEGSVSFAIRKLKIAGSGKMRMFPKVPAWIVDIEMDLSVPLALGGTGLGIYGFRGIIGSHFVASKTHIQLPEDAPWYDYLKKPPRGVHYTKFDPSKKGFSLGVGASIATMGDNGWTFSSKVMVLLSMPEMILIEGQANALHKRLGIEDTNDPPFYAYLVIDSQSIQAGLGVKYNLPNPGGTIMSLKGEMQLGFFFNNASAWYLNIGKDMPEDKRVQARLLTLFNAYAYLMVSARGIKAGAGAKFEKHINFRVAKIGLYAYIDTKGFISFKPVQIGGAIQLGGGVYIRVWRFKIEFHVAAGLSAEAPKPFIIAGFLEIRLRVLFLKIRVKISFTWVFIRELSLDPLPIMDAREFKYDPNTKELAQAPVKAVHMLTNEPFKIFCESGDVASFPVNAITDEYIIPVDSYVDIEFKFPVKPYTTRYGGGVSPAPQFEVLVAPQKAASPQVKHKLYVQKVDIYIHDPSAVGGGWKAYDVWQPLLQTFQALQLNTNVANYNYGNWQYNNVPGRYTSLRLLAPTPLSVSNGTPVEHFGVLSEHILCRGKIKEHTCQNWLEQVRIYPEEVLFRDRKLMMRFIQRRGFVGYAPNLWGFGQSLGIKGGNTLEIIFHEPVSSVRLKVTAFHYAYILFYVKVFDDEPSLSNLPSYHYEVVDKMRIDASLTDEIVREFPGMPVAKIDIVAGDCGRQVVPIKEQHDEWVRLRDEGGLNELETDRLNTWTQLKPKFAEANAEARGPLMEAFANAEGEVLTGYANQWLDEFSGGEVDPFMLSNLCDHWHYLLKYAKQENLSPEERVRIKEWITQFCPMQDDAIRDAKVLCEQWFEIMIQPEIAPALLNYAVQWHNRYCGGETDICAVYLHEICWLTEADYGFNIVLQQNNQQVITTGVNTINQAINEALMPIWRPNSKYAVEITVKDEVYAASALNNAVSQKFVFGFKTAGSLGFFHRTQQAYHDLVQKNMQDQYPLADLRHYIDTIRSFPDASGKLLNAKPLYYVNPKLHLYFNKSYAAALFTSWGFYQGNPAATYKLLAYIKDPTQPDINTPAIDPIEIGWVVHKGQQSIPVNSLETETFHNIIQIGDTPCQHVVQTLKPPTASAVVEIESLQPQKNYRAVFKAIEQRAGAEDQVSIVHSYPFITSKYKNFVEQVGSYLRKVVDVNTGGVQYVKAFHRMYLNTANFSALQAEYLKIVDDTQDSNSTMLTGYASKYDRIMNGLFKFSAQDAVVDTDLHVIKRFAGQEKFMVGIVLRNPEPFNDPRLPASEMIQTVQLRDEISGSTNFVVVFSKDNSRIFISNRDLNLEKRRHVLRLRYIRYDGKTYSTAEEVNIRLYLNRF